MNSLFSYNGLFGLKFAFSIFSELKNFQFSRNHLYSCFVLSDQDVWLKSGRIVGEAVIDKNELFNLASDGVTAVRDDRNTIIGLSSLSHYSNEVKFEAESMEQQQQQQDIGIKSSKRISKRTKNREKDDTSNVPDTFNGLPTVHEPNQLGTKMEMPDAVVGQELCDPSLDDDLDIVEDIAPIEDISTRIPLNDKPMNNKPPPVSLPVRETEDPPQLETKTRLSFTKCRICAATFPSVDRDKHYKEKHCTCHCGKTFRKPGNMRSHMSTVHDKVKRFTCSTCEKTFYSSGAKRSHEERCNCEKTERKPHPCRICPKNLFASKKEREIHVIQEHRKCHICDKTFSNAHSLCRHVATVHQNARPYECSECGKTFKDVCSRNTHVQIVHEKKQGVVCSTCGKHFSGVSALNSHMKRIHVGVKNFACALCPTKFHDACRLRVHMRAVHEGIKTISCKECDAKFARLDSLTQHMKYKHSEPQFSCSFCPKKFAAKAKQQNHEKTHLGTLTVDLV